MFKIGDRVLYGIHGLCAIVDLEFQTVNKRKVEYFVLEPMEQPGTRYYVPTQNQAAIAKLRPMITKEALVELLHADSVRNNAWIADENQRKQHYRDLICSGDREALICMVGTLYKHRQEQQSSGRKFHLCDENFLRDAERLLNIEFSVVLGIPQDQVSEYVRRAVQGE